MEAKEPKRLTLNLPADLHKRVKLQAVEEETTMTDMVIRWIQERLDGRVATPPPHPRNTP